jgi:hypothetical protein
MAASTDVARNLDPRRRMSCRPQVGFCLKFRIACIFPHPSTAAACLGLRTIAATSLNAGRSRISYTYGSLPGKEDFFLVAR